MIVHYSFQYSLNRVELCSVFYAQGITASYHHASVNVMAHFKRCDMYIYIYIYIYIFFHKDLYFRY